MKNRPAILFFLIFLSTTILSSCGLFQKPALEPTSTPTVDETASIFSVYLPPYIPGATQTYFFGEEYIRVISAQDDADIRLDISATDPLFIWTYCLVGPFSSLNESVSSGDLLAFWEGDADAWPDASKVYIDGSVKAVFEKIWGLASGQTIAESSASTILTDVWESENAFAIIPFESLEPQWKVIAIDGISPIDKSFEPEKYILNVPFGMAGDQQISNNFTAQLIAASSESYPIRNRNPEKMTTVAMTGVTALVRGTAYVMEKSGYTYPAIDVGDILRTADILHISNEIPFTQTCPNPFADAQKDENLVFCSKPAYIQLLEAIGTDVVEVTGDHFRDWGPEAMLQTLSLYDERGWQYYGGGINFNDGIQPALFEHNGNKIAFLGCNAKPKGYATAGEDYPCAVHCDFPVMADEIKKVADEGYAPIFTFQHIEYYSYKRNDALVEDFQAMADAGAVIVSGSQAHQPHAFEFYKTSYLHYGLGNLFFDQYKEGFAQRQSFIDQHIFYDGKHISTKLITLMFIDLARPRLMTDDERIDLLQIVFSASGWQY